MMSKATHVAGLCQDGQRDDQSHTREGTQDVIIGVASQQLIGLRGQSGALLNEYLVSLKLKAKGHDRNLSEAKLKARMRQLEASLARYLDELDRADREPGQLPEARVAYLQRKIATVREHM